jgi:ABC-type nickel/cobalt efflux system permease component RcnA
VLVEGRAADFPALEIRTAGLAPWPAACALLLFGLLLGLALLKLVAMLRQIEGGAPFAAAGLRGFARYLFLAVLATVFAPPLLQAATGAHRIDLSLGSGAALMLIVTGLLFFVARLLDEARRLADDHSQIV